ncbi:MAG: substrate-binding domain-containing protein [Candidatus Bipolaricaulia bacterium]
MRHRKWLAGGGLSGIFAALLLASVGLGGDVLRLGTTTSTDNSGLLEAILPAFETSYGIDVDVVAVGTGQALEMGRRGDVDVLLVHARTLEDEFVDQGYGPGRYAVMFNDFVLVGPNDDPAGIRGSERAATALETIAATEAPFASRGDDSGTHIKEQALWEAAGLATPAGEDWYNSLGQGMGATLIFANEARAYTLADRGTYLSMRDGLPNLEVLTGGSSIADNRDPALRNPYSVIPVSIEKFDWINADAAAAFVVWLTSVAVQEAIGAFGVEAYGQPLFYPDSEPYRNRREGS